MGLCSSDDKKDRIDKYIHIAGHKVTKEEGLIEKVKEVTAAESFGAGADLAVVAHGEGSLILVKVFDSKEAMDKYQGLGGKVATEALSNHIEGNASISAEGKQFFRNFKPCQPNETIRISTYGFSREEGAKFLTFEKEAERPEGQHGCAFGEDAHGKIFGYQIYEKLDQAKAFKEKRMKDMKDAGMQAEDSACLTGTILHADCTAALFDAIPGGPEVRNVVGSGVDNVEWAISHLPLGNYVVDGTQYVVSGVEGGVTTVVTTGTDGMKTSYQVSAGVVKEVPGASHVVDAAETAVTATTDGVKSGAKVVGDTANSGIQAGKSGVNATTTAVDGAARSVPGVSHAVEGAEAGISHAQEAGKTVSETTKAASSAADPGNRSCW